MHEGAASSEDSPADDDQGDVEARLRALEAQVERLTSRVVGSSPAEAQPSASPSARDQETFWALTALEERLPDPGGVVFAGSVTTGAGQVRFQWGRPTETVLSADWAERAEAVDALGHPLRLAILRRLVDGERTVAHLVDELELGSTGVAYHHLNALQSGGWVTSPRRGTWAIPPTRVVPLLTILIALEKG